jgi:hypothetical protein
MTLHRHAPRRDEGERQIVSALRQVGAFVWPVSQKGLPDLLVLFRGEFVLLEVKQPRGPRGGESADGQSLNPEQQEFFDKVGLQGGKAYVVRTPEEALRAVGVVYSGAAST